MKPTPKTKNFRRFVAAMQQIMTVSKREITDLMEQAKADRLNRKMELIRHREMMRSVKAVLALNRESKKISKALKTNPIRSYSLAKLRLRSKEREERRKYLGRRRYWTKQLEICVNCYEENHLACDGGQCKCTCGIDLDRHKKIR